jgi:hypothetical protein
MGPDYQLTILEKIQKEIRKKTQKEIRNKTQKEIRKKTERNTKELTFGRRKKCKEEGIGRNTRYTDSQPLLKIRGMEEMTTEMPVR